MRGCGGTSNNEIGGSEVILAHEDKRTIKTIFYEGDGAGEYIVGGNGITKIEAYGENGEMAQVVWFAIYKGDFLWMRVNGKRIDGVIYEEADMPNETKCPTCEGLCKTSPCTQCEGTGEISTAIGCVCSECGGSGVYFRSIAAERAEREMWERHCPSCKHYIDAIIDLHQVDPACCDITGEWKDFDTCPLRTQSGYKRTQKG